MGQKLSLNKLKFKKFLESLGKIHDSLIIDITKTGIHGLSTSSDRAMFLWSFYEGDFDFERTLNIQSLSKLSKCIDLISGDTVDLKLNSNNIEYIGGGVKWKCHLYEDGVLTKSKLTRDKIQTFKYDLDFTFTKSFLVDLLKRASIFRDTNKLYLYTDGGELIWSLMDRCSPNSDMFTVIGDSVDFIMDEFILNLDNLRLLSLNKDCDVKFSLSDQGIGCIETVYDNLKLKYIVTSLVK